MGAVEIFAETPSIGFSTDFRSVKNIAPVPLFNRVGFFVLFFFYRVINCFRISAAVLTVLIHLNYWIARRRYRTVKKKKVMIATLISRGATIVIRSFESPMIYNRIVFHAKIYNNQCKFSKRSENRRDILQPFNYCENKTDGQNKHNKNIYLNFEMQIARYYSFCFQLFFFFFLFFSFFS